ncbi:DUF2997 domain-containing protein [Bacillus toyonensis]|uniref:DUF2997 domain-containing protein n=1 Tax=Bacillus thuringiensis TaxID=1428 RepID=A0A9X7BT31_BACTU|nr:MULTISPECIES: DUF2997 domain-containing protein [Bacillus cereus group]MCU5503660.1 DUF2997 domain-containing protein [Bacillus cereus]EOO44419.1 hypothetical protein ICK_06194 [Bacillus cereus BAG1X2-2]MCU5224048.1 DUF2997 domain-containing protein [Bacillus tropicus]MDR5047845.1 DUF2997 domain-containing protein [Bacillus thuringiensis]MEB9419937.1 DUF2997 domain-containing protein [Bacillus cereus]
MEQTKVQFTVKPGGAINMEVVNGVGQSCVDVTQELEVSLAKAGSRKSDEGKKPEYYDGGANISAFNDLTGM